MENRNNYVEIDLLDLCKEVLKKWKVIVAAILIGAILVGLYGVFTSKQEKPESAAEVKALTAELTNEEKTDVENAAKMIQSYRTMYNSQKDYCDNSIYQKLDPYAINSIVLSYYVDNGYKVSYPIIAEQNKVIPIVQMYANVLQDEDFYTELVKELKIDVDPTYLAEVISVDIGGSGEGIIDSGVFDITVYADSDELLTKVAEYIKAALSNKTNEVVEFYGDHELLLSSEVTKKTVDTDVAVKQQENLDSLSKITTSIKNIENGFSGSQLTYLKYLVHEELEETTNVAKYFVIGALIGAVIATAYYIVKYLLSKTVKTEAELTSILNVNSFGKLAENDAFVASKIMNAIEKSDAKKLAIVSDVEDERINKLAELIKADVEIVINPLNEQDAFESLTDCDAVVFIEELKTSNRSDVIAKKTICDGSDIKVLGIVLK